MKYTLDSKELIEQALKASNKTAKNIFSEPMLKSGLELAELTNKTDTVYFGVLTLGAGVNGHVSYLGNEVIKVDPSSQIIIPFTEIIFKDDADLVIDPVGLFVGFEIQIQRN